MSEQPSHDNIPQGRMVESEGEQPEVFFGAPTEIADAKSREGRNTALLFVAMRYGCLPLLGIGTCIACVAFAIAMEAL